MQTCNAFSFAAKHQIFMVAQAAPTSIDTLEFPPGKGEPSIHFIQTSKKMQFLTSWYSTNPHCFSEVKLPLDNHWVCLPDLERMGCLGDIKSTLSLLPNRPLTRFIYIRFTWGYLTHYGVVDLSNSFCVDGVLQQGKKSKFFENFQNQRIGADIG